MKEYIADACIKRYEYTVETAWKMMKKFLKLEYGKKRRRTDYEQYFPFYGRIRIYSFLGKVA